MRRLSRGLLDQRTELESFFIGALAQVKKEIAANRHVHCSWSILLNGTYTWCHVFEPQGFNAVVALISLH